MQFLLTELIGKRVKVAKSSCKGLEGIEGTVIDETQNTLIVKTKKGRKTVPKASSTFEFNETNTHVKGTMLLHKPQERIKKILPKIR